MDYIRLEISENIATITLKNDERRNSLCERMLSELEATFIELESQNIRVVILKSNLDAKVWCAGLDIKELPNAGKDPLPYSHPLESLMRKIENFNAPVIAMITGSVWGGGMDLALTCDFIIGSPECSFAITPAKIGVPYNVSGLIHFLNVVEMNIAKELFFTAKPMMSERAYIIGLINHLIDKDKIEEFTYDLANTICNNSPLSIGVIKKQLNLLGKAKPLSPDMMEDINELRFKAYTSHDFAEGKLAFLEKRKPLFKGE
jgi:methylmalonyl-CoA decarboxylase